jgi:hypothetical protein
MTQSFFSQCVAVLVSEAPGLAELRLILEREGYTIKADEDVSQWPEMQGAGLTLATDFANGASCWVDICEFPWPDDLGVTEPPTLVTGAHMMGAFGPFSHPGAFARALQAPGYDAVAQEARRHRAFVRFRVSYLIPSSGESAEARFASAENANPTWEIGWLLRAAASLRGMPTALAYFNPAGELLLPMQALTGLITFAFEHKTFPVEAVCRVRGCPVDEQWSLVDSLGMAQFGLRDHEFAWSGTQPSRQEQVAFLINLLRYQISEAAPMAGGHTTDGPQNKLWRAEEREASCMIPERKSLHWRAEGDPPEPECLQSVGVPDEDGVAATEDEADLINEMAAMRQTLSTWLPQREMMRMRAAYWLRSPEFLTSYYDEAHYPEMLPLALKRGMSKKEARETMQSAQHLGQQSKALWAQYQELGDKGKVWLATPVMTNPGFATNPETLLPCGVIVALGQSAEAMTVASVFSGHAYSLYSGEGDAQKYPKTARIMANDQYRLFYRELFPLEETLGENLLYMCILLRKDWMPPQDVPFVPLLVFPGDKGAAVQIPWHVVTGKPAPRGAAKPGRFAELAALDRQAEQVIASEYSGCGGLIRRCWHILLTIMQIIFWISVIGGIIVVFLGKK